MNSMGLPGAVQPEPGYGDPSPASGRVHFLDHHRAALPPRPTPGGIGHLAPADGTALHDDVPHIYDNLSGIAGIGAVLLMSLLLWVPIAVAGWWLLW